MIAAKQSKDECIRAFVKNNDKCHEALSGDKYLLGDNFDKHYTRTRVEFAECVNKAKTDYDTCDAYNQCNSRLTEEKALCDKSYFDAAKARKVEVRSNFDTMDKCYRDSLQLHWKCNDAVNTYDVSRQKCNTETIEKAKSLTDNWKK